MSRRSRVLLALAIAFLHGYPAGAQHKDWPVDCASPWEYSLAPENRDECGSTELMLSSYCGNAVKVRELLDAGVNPDATGNLCPIQWPGSWMRLPTNALDLASMQGHVDAVRELLAVGGDPNVALSWVFHMDVGDEGDDYAVIGAAMSAGGELEEVQTAFLCTLMTIAAVRGDLPIVRALLNAGVHIDERNSQNCNPSALSFAATNGTMYSYSSGLAERMGLTLPSGHEALDDFAFGGGESGASGPYPRHSGTALMWAAALGEIDVVKLLLNGGADPVATNPNGDRAIDWALEGSHQEVASLLVLPAQKQRGRGEPSSGADR